MKRLLAGTALALVACDGLSFVAPQLRAPSLFLYAQVRHDDSVRWGVGATLFPGQDASGAPGSFLDSRLGIEDSLLAPMEANRSPLQFHWSGTRAALQPHDSVVIRIPRRVASDSDGIVRIPVGLRIGPEDVTLRPDEDLTLRIARPAFDSTAFALDFSQWRLEIRADCATSTTDSETITLQATNSYPTELRLGRMLVTASPGDTVHACFSSFSSYRGVSLPYQITVAVNLHTAWRIRLIDH